MRRKVTKRSIRNLLAWRRFSMNTIKYTFVLFVSLLVACIIIHISFSIFTYNNEMELKLKYDKLVVPGLGDMGQEAILHMNGLERAKMERGLWDYGINVWISERISLQRRLPDVRDEKCRHVYIDMEILPNVTIVLPYYNEHPTIILRALYSIVNRSPKQILQEILLIDTSNEKYKKQFKNFPKIVKNLFPDLVRLFTITKQVGLNSIEVLVRQKATAEIIVFVESSIEVTPEWLPALVWPIVTNEKIVTIPSLDRIEYKLLRYEITTPKRINFNWHFDHEFKDLTVIQARDLPNPFENPVMPRQIFAITAAFLKTIGGLDEGFSIGGGEQYLLSMKTWMCGGRIWEIPCSRIGFIEKSEEFLNTIKGDKAIGAGAFRNFKRMIDIWFDDYKDIIYERIPQLKKIDAGNMTEQKNIRAKCQTMHWYIKHVMPNMMQIYPNSEPNEYAYGIVQSMGNSKYCLSLDFDPGTRIVYADLKFCQGNVKFPDVNQRFTLSKYGDIRQRNLCLDIRLEADNSTSVIATQCHRNGGTQLWFYDYRSMLLVHSSTKNMKRCITAILDDFDVVLIDCDFENPWQRWLFGYSNETALDRYYEYLSHRKLKQN